MGLFDSIRRVVGGGESTDAEDAATDERDADLIDTRELDVTALRQQAEGVAAEVEQLDFSLDSLGQFDAAIEAGYDEALPTTDDPETYPRDVVRFGCYLGEVLVRAYGGRWEQNPEWGVTVSGSEDEATVAVFRVATRSITDEAVFAAVAERVAQEVGLDVDDGPPESADDGADDGSHERDEPDDADDTAGDDAVESDTSAGDDEAVPDESEQADEADETGADEEPPVEPVASADADVDSDGAESASETEESGTDGLSERRPREPDALKSGFGAIDDPAAEATAAPEPDHDAGAAAEEPPDEADGVDSTAPLEPDEDTDEPDESDPDEPTATESFEDKWDDDTEVSDSGADETLSTDEIASETGPDEPENGSDEPDSDGERMGAEPESEADAPDSDDGRVDAEPESDDESGGLDSGHETVSAPESEREAPDTDVEAEAEPAAGDDGDDVSSLVEEAEPDADEGPWFEEAEPEQPAAEASSEATDPPDDTAATGTERPESLFGGDEPDTDPMPPAADTADGPVSATDDTADSEGDTDETADDGPMPPADDTADGSVSPADDTADEPVSPADDEPDPTEGDGLRAAYAEEADAFVTFWGEHDLDYSPDSLSRLDDLVAAEWDDDRFETATFQSDETFDDRAFTSVVTELGSYFGEVLVRDLDAEWSDQTANDSVIVDGVDGQLAIPVFRVAETSLRKAPVFARSYDSLLDDLGRN